MSGAAPAPNGDDGFNPIHRSSAAEAFRLIWGVTDEAPAPVPSPRTSSPRTKGPVANSVAPLVVQTPPAPPAATPAPVVPVQPIPVEPVERRMTKQASTRAMPPRPTLVIQSAPVSFASSGRRGSIRGPPPAETEDEILGKISESTRSNDHGEDWPDDHRDTVGERIVGGSLETAEVQHLRDFLMRWVNAQVNPDSGAAVFHSPIAFEKMRHVEHLRKLLKALEPRIVESSLKSSEMNWNWFVEELNALEVKPLMPYHCFSYWALHGPRRKGGRRDFRGPLLMLLAALYAAFCDDERLPLGVQYMVKCHSGHYHMRLLTPHFLLPLAAVLDVSSAPERAPAECHVVIGPQHTLMVGRAQSKKSSLCAPSAKDGLPRGGEGASAAVPPGQSFERSDSSTSQDVVHLRLGKPCVSGTHLVIRHTGAGFCIEDKSTYGTHWRDAKGVAVAVTPSAPLENVRTSGCITLAPRDNSPVFIRVRMIWRAPEEFSESLPAHRLRATADNFFMACMTGSSAMVGALMDESRGYLDQRFHCPLPQYPLRPGSPVMAPLAGEWAMTPLHAACCGGHTAVVKLLMRQPTPPDVNAPDSRHWLPLDHESHTAVLGFDALMAVRNAKGVVSPCGVPPTEDRLQDSLQWALARKDLAAFEQFVSDPRVRDIVVVVGNRIMQAVCSLGREDFVIEAVKLLLARGCIAEEAAMRETKSAEVLALLLSADSKIPTNYHHVHLLKEAFFHAVRTFDEATALPVVKATLPSLGQLATPVHGSPDTHDPFRHALRFDKPSAAAHVLNAMKPTYDWRSHSPFEHPPRAPGSVIQPDGAAGVGFPDTTAGADSTPAPAEPVSPTAPAVVSAAVHPMLSTQNRTAGAALTTIAAAVAARSVATIAAVNTAAVLAASQAVSTENLFPRELARRVMQYACAEGLVHAVRVLVDDFNIEVESSDVATAARNGHDEVVALLISGPNGLKSIHFLRLEWRDLQNFARAILDKSRSRELSLHTLNFERCHIGYVRDDQKEERVNERGSYLVSALKFLPLTHLELTSCEISRSFMFAFSPWLGVEENPNAHHEDVRNLSAISEPPSPRGVRHPQGFGSTATPVTDILKTLIIRDCNLDSIDGACLANGLMANTTLCDICLEDNEISSLVVVRKLMAAVAIKEGRNGQLIPQTCCEKVGAVFDCTGWLIACGCQTPPKDKPNLPRMFGRVEIGKLLKSFFIYFFFGIFIMVSSSLNVAVESWRQHAKDVKAGVEAPRETEDLVPPDHCFGLRGKAFRWWCFGKRLSVDFASAMSKPKNYVGIHVMFVSALIWAYAMLYPVLLPYWIMPFQADARRGAFIGVAFFFVVLFAWMVFVFVLAALDKERAFIHIDRRNYHDTVRILEDDPTACCGVNWRNCMAIGVITIECLQFSALAFLSSQQLFPQSARPDVILKPFMLDFGSDNGFLASFWLIVIVASIWWIVACYLAANAHNGKVAASLASFPSADLLAGLLSNTLFLPVMSTLTKALDCTYVPQPDGTYMMTVDALTSLMCWGPEHNRLVTVSMVLMMAYVFSAAFIGINFTIDHSTHADVQFVVLFALGDRIVKLLASTFVIFFQNNGFVGLIAILILEVSLLAVTLWTQPCTNASVNGYKAMTYVIAGWSVACCLVGHWAGARGSWALFGVIIAGWAVILIGAIVMAVTRGSLACGCCCRRPPAAKSEEAPTVAPTSSSAHPTTTVVADPGAMEVASPTSTSAPRLVTVSNNALAHETPRSDETVMFTVDNRSPVMRGREDSTPPTPTPTAARL